MFTFVRRLIRTGPKKVVAIIAARNEEHYIRKCVEDLIDNDLEVAVLDNDSTDATPAIISDLSPRLLFHGKIPHDGTVNLRRLLEAKMALAKQLAADWIIHVDADEILRSCRSGETVRAGIQRAAKAGANTINFREFVFVPTTRDEDFRGSDYVEKMKWYYFFDRGNPMRMLAFSTNLSNVDGAGHRVDGEVTLHREDFVMCHYIALNLQMLKDKYAARRYPESALEMGWHRTRANIDIDNIPVPATERLKYWRDNRPESLDKSNPQDKHFWEWK